MSDDSTDRLTPMEARRRILGEQPDIPLRASSLSTPIVDWTAESVWTVWARPGLDLKTRALVVCTALAVLNRLDKLEVHLAGALRQGWTPEELGEAMLQMTTYAGVGAGTDAFVALAKAAAVIDAEKAAQG